MSTPVFFTLKLNSDAQLRRLMIGGEFDSKVLVEGVLGKIGRLEDFEGTLVRIEFDGGEISLDVSLEELRGLLEKRGKRQRKTLAGERVG